MYLSSDKHRSFIPLSTLQYSGKMIKMLIYMSFINPETCNKKFCVSHLFPLPFPCCSEEQIQKGLVLWNQSSNHPRQYNGYDHQTCHEQKALSIFSKILFYLTIQYCVHSSILSCILQCIMGKRSLQNLTVFFRSNIL